jgi:hypothetical protein
MKFKTYLSESKYSNLYHVASTKVTTKIKKDGIVPQKKPSWTGAMGQDIRDCKDCVYAFTDLKDAIRWAFKAEWDNKGTKFNIISFDGSGSKWDKDTHFEASMAEGEWIRTKDTIQSDKIKDIQPMSPKLARSAVQ